MDLSLPAIFSDRMVLQQNSEVPFWGTASPGASVRVRASWDQDLTTVSNEIGKWKIDVKTPPAGGPYHVAVSSGDSVFHINNVLIGEVWLCSGQSNMEMPLRGWPPNELIENSNEAIRSAHFPELRFFTVERAMSTHELADLSGEWEDCNPRTASYFSATAFYFGRKLHQELNVPIGLIHASWGGSTAEAWTRGKDLAELESFKDVMAQLKSAIPQQEQYEKWLDKLKKVDLTGNTEETRFTGIDFWDKQLAAANHDDSDWPLMSLPEFWEDTIGQFNGVVWYRKTIEIPESWLNNTLIMELAFIDDMDRTYINGYQVGGYETLGFWNAPRRYDLPEDKNTSTKLTIAVRVMDTGGGGGIYGSLDRMKIYPQDRLDIAMPLYGEWRYLVVGEFRNNVFFKYGPDVKFFNSRPEVSLSLDHLSPTLLYNGMIAPLVPYTINGVIWYQGESNVGRAEQYTQLFPSLIGSWRDLWHNEKLSFNYVQIAPFVYSNGNGTEAGELRNSQRLSQTVPNTGMVVTLDLGHPTNIHPPKKRAVGERLALKALHNTYGHNQLVHSGPSPKSLKVESKIVRISFNHVDSGLKPVDDNMEGFEIAGPLGAFRTATARIEGNQVLVDNPEGYEMVTIRYAYRNAAKATLFNQEGLPASTFEITNEEVVQ
ncbi:MAG: sialate O-acetylesterase [Bacteroidota bacterium]